MHSELGAIKESSLSARNEWHYGTNHGTEPVEMIAFYAGVNGTPITFRRNSGLGNARSQTRLD